MLIAEGRYTDALDESCSKLLTHQSKNSKSEIWRAKRMRRTIFEQMASREGVTEQLKADNQMEWVGRTNNIRNRATEIVNSDVIYT